MISFKKLVKLVGLLVFGIAMIVYFFSAERTGSLWDCGEFILGAYKLQVVHPPGAPLFMIVGRIFAGLGSWLSPNPEAIAFAVNLMSGMWSALAATLVASMTMILGKMSIAGRSGDLDQHQRIAVAGAGLVAGLATAFCTSIWFSAVEGEVYAMSTFFTALTVWAGVRWYYLPKDVVHDKWLVFAMFAGGLSVGVHLLSLLTFPALALLYYFKKYERHTLWGTLLAFLAGSVWVFFVLKIVIVGIPTLWKNFELMMVNGAGMPFHSGLIPALLLIGALAFALLKWAHMRKRHLLQILTMGALMTVIGFSTFGVVLLRANADTPINMNVPDDAVRLLPYLNREQYGERPLIYGTHFEAQAYDLTREKRHGRVGDRYEYVDEKYDHAYHSKDKMLLPRIGHNDPGRAQLHRIWYNYLMGKEFRDGSNPGQLYNIRFLLAYQINWMYWRYFMWNFAGRQNGEQGFYPWDKKSGHWISGIEPMDEARLYKMDDLTETMQRHRGTNKYYFIPLILGLIGLIYHARNRQKEFLFLLTLFLITGIGIIFYSNQPPNEPRERDYVLVGSFFTFCIWIGMSVIVLFRFLASKLRLAGHLGAALAVAIALIAPTLMAYQNFDDHSRIHHKASRDYASNFLESCEPNAIIFTYGDNDTYPLWYAQEVEGIRTDVRVVNLSLIAVDWYINKLRSKVNNSPPIKLTISEAAYRGKNRNQLPFYNPSGNDQQPMDIRHFIRYIGEDHPISAGQISFKSHIPTRRPYIAVDSARAVRNGIIRATDTNLVKRIPINLARGSYLTKDEIAVLDIIASNIWERPIYFASTCKNEKLLGLNDYMSYEGLGLQVVPIRTPSDKSLSIYGSGRIDVDRVYRNVMERFRWGNFDQRELFVDNSYAAEIQAHKLVIMRAAEELSRLGDHDRAVRLADKYFASFPHYNFAYDAGIMPFVDVYIKAGAFDKAKQHMRILAKEAEENLRFYDSISEDGSDIIESSFSNDYRFALKSVQDILRDSKRVEDPAFEKEMTDLLSAYDITNLRQ